MASTSSTNQTIQQFGRNCRLEIGNTTEGVAIINLRVTFNIRKSSDKHPNKSTISVYNLNESSRHKLAEKTWNYCKLYVGYGLANPSLKLIYEGDITRVNDTRSGMDILTTLECGDGRNAYNNGYVNKTLAKGYTWEDVLDECLSAMPGVQEGFISFPTTKQFPRARTLTGQAHQILDSVAKATNSDWSIQSGLLTFLPKNGVTDYDIPLISATSGMINEPKATDKGLQVSCNLNPVFAIGGAVAVSSIFTQYNGQYKIDTIDIRGDTDPKGQWVSELAILGGNFGKVVRRKKKKKVPAYVEPKTTTQVG